MNFIYIGSSRPESITKELLDMGSTVNFAGNTLQQALLTGFAKHVEDMKVITSWGISTYPKVKRLFFPRKKVQDTVADDYIYVGAVNLPFINLISRFIRTRRELKRMLSKCESNIVVVYEVHTPFMLAAVSLRKHIDKICLIVPDLPEFMSAPGGKLKLFLKSIDKKLINRCIGKIDKFVLLSDLMKERLPLERKECMLLEGIFQNNQNMESKPKEQHKTIMYTGGIYWRRGTDMLLDAFQQIPDPDYRLWIRGNGDMEDEIKKRSKEDPRIVYFPPMEREQLLELERKATVMVNPTPANLDFTKYFFPSKTMEYLASGTPTIMFRLGCMPKEYDSYLFYVEDNTVESLRDKIIEVCEKTQEELNAFGTRAQEFILTKKTPEVQCGRIIDMLI